MLAPATPRRLRVNILEITNALIYVDPNSKNTDNGVILNKERYMKFELKRGGIGNTVDPFSLEEHMELHPWAFVGLHQYVCAATNAPISSEKNDERYNVRAVVLDGDLLYVYEDNDTKFFRAVHVISDGYVNSVTIHARLEDAVKSIMNVVIIDNTE